MQIYYKNFLENKSVKVKLKICDDVICIFKHNPENLSVNKNDAIDLKSQTFCILLKMSPIKFHDTRNGRVK